MTTLTDLGSSLRPRGVKRSARALVLAGLALAGCANDTAGEDPSTDDAIVGGVRSGPADDAVVYVYSGVPCTGVLVSENVVLTALHCVAQDIETASTACSADAAPVGAIVPASAVRVSVGSTITSLTSYDVRDIVTGPSRRMCNGDVAALVLASPVRGVAPRAIRTTPISTGHRLTAVGWGVGGVGGLPDFRQRRSGIAVLHSGAGTTTTTDSAGIPHHVTSGSKELVTGESICHGDSGGPLFDEQGKLAAIVSRVLTPCVGTLAVHSDASYWASLVAEARSR